MCFGGGKKDNSAAEAERARQAEQARLAALKQAEEARILQETLNQKSQQANKEAADNAARAKFQSRVSKTALEDPEAEKKKSLLSNYAN